MSMKSISLVTWGSCYLMAFVLLFHLLEQFPCISVEPSLSLCFQAPSNIPCISHVLHRNISMWPWDLCAGKLHGFNERGLLFRTQTAPGILHVRLFLCLSRACPGTSIKRKEAEVISIIWLRWVSFTKLCYENKMFLPSLRRQYLLFNVILKQIVCVKFALLLIAQRFFSLLLLPCLAAGKSVLDFWCSINFTDAFIQFLS